MKKILSGQIISFMSAVLCAACLTTSCAKEETQIKVTGVRLDKTKITLVEGESKTLVVTVTPNNAVNKKVIWTSDKPSVATVDATGNVTAVKAGEAKVTVTTEDGGKSASCKVIVTARIAVTGVSLDKTEIDLVEGESEALAVTVTPDDATNKNVTWTSGNPAVATVDDTGNVTAVKAGEAEITVTTEDGGKSASCKVTVTVKIAVTGVNLNKTEIDLVEGKSETLVATVIPDDATNKKVTWASGNPAVATVDAEGNVTAVKAGGTEVTVTTEDGGKTDVCTVIVRRGNQTITVGEGENAVTFEMIYVEGGTFLMGAQSTDPDGQNYDPEAIDDNETPVHEVTLSDYYIGQTEVTQELWEAVMSMDMRDHCIWANISDTLRGIGDSYPMYYVPWDYFVENFLPQLNRMTGRTFVLPTEAQWEFAARGGNRSKGYIYSGSNDIDEVAWYADNSDDGQTHPVGEKLPNELGIYDMSGNVFEWCSDWWDAHYYRNSESVDPQGPSSSPENARVGRGGCFPYNAVCCRVSNRGRGTSNFMGYAFGFRLVLKP